VIHCYFVYLLPFNALVEAVVVAVTGFACAVFQRRKMDYTRVVADNEMPLVATIHSVGTARLHSLPHEGLQISRC